MIFNGDTIRFFIDTVTSIPYLPIDGYYMEPGDSINVGFGFTIGDGWDTGLADFCLTIMPSNTADTLMDTATSDNKDCATIFSAADPVGVIPVSEASPVSVYPNPATGIANFDFVLTQPGAAEFQLYSMTGQRVHLSTIETKSGRNIFSINTAELQPGLYLYRLRINEGISIGKLQVRH